MVTANPLGSNQSITLERNKVITITKRTVRFSRNVYQTHNIAEFGEGEVDIGTIPWIIIIGILIVALIVGVFNSGVGVLLSVIWIGCAV